MATSLIPRDKMTELKTAKECEEIAKAAEAIQELQSVAYAINNATNTGETEVTWANTLMETTQSALTTAGYKFKAVEGTAKPNTKYVISWKSKED